MIYRAISYVSWLFLFLISFSLVAIFLILAYIFYRPEINLFGQQIENSFHDMIIAFPFWMYLIICVTVLSLLFVVIFLVINLFYTFINKRNLALRIKYDNTSAIFLSRLFISDLYKTEKQKKEYYRSNKQYFITRLQLLSFLDTFLKIQDLLDVDLSDDFRSLVRYFHLQRRIERLLYHREIDDRILAMKIFAYLGIDTHNEQILKYAKSKNLALRVQAYVAIIQLVDSSRRIKELIGQINKLSLLGVNILANVLLKKDNNEVDYRALLESKQERINMLGLLLVKYKFKDRCDNLQLIIQYLNSDDEQVKRLAWSIMPTIVPKDEAVGLITDSFEAQTDIVKLSIVKNSHGIVNKRLLDYYFSVIKKQTLQAKIEIMRIFYENDFNQLTNFENSTDDDIKMAYNEISDMYINI
jgi:hypothetical protein